MYRIELSPGEETAFRSIEELAVAIRRKVVTPRARIYHNATSKWLPIQFHPHYKIAVSMPLTQADLVAGPPLTPLSSLKLGEIQSPAPAPTPPAPSSRQAATQAALAAWPAPKAVAPPPAKETAAPAPRELLAREAPIMLGTPAPEPPRVPASRQPEPLRSEAPRVVPPARTATTQGKGSRKRRKSTRSLHIALAGAVVAACAQLVISGASSRALDIGTRVHSPRRLIEAPIEAMMEDSPRTVAGVLPALQTIPLPHKPAFLKRPAKPVSPARAPKATPPAALAGIPEPTIDSATIPEIEPAPDAGDMTVGGPTPVPVPMAPKGDDSTSKKSMTRILHTIGGTSGAESKPPKP